MNDIYHTGEICGLIFTAIKKDWPQKTPKYEQMKPDDLINLISTEPAQFKNYFSEEETKVPELEYRFNLLNEADFVFQDHLEPYQGVQFFKGFSHEISGLTRCFELHSIRKELGMSRDEFSGHLHINQKSLRDFEKLHKLVPHAILAWARSIKAAANGR